MVVLILMIGAIALLWTRPAAADRCGEVEPVYAVTSTGELVEQLYCTEAPGGFLPPRTVAIFEPPTAPRFLWGGVLPDGGAALYGVSGDGALWWFRQDAGTRRLDPPVRVGAALGDWNRYDPLFGTGDGELYGVDGRGHLMRWRHSGWRTGGDTWAARPDDLGVTCAGSRPVHAGLTAPLRYVGLAADPPSYIYCPLSGSPQLASLLPDGILAGSATAAPAPGVTYALAGNDRHLVRLVLDTRASPHRWQPGATAGSGYAAVFTGRTFFLGVPPPERLPYEWQAPWYGGGITPPREPDPPVTAGPP